MTDCINSQRPDLAQSYMFGPPDPIYSFVQRLLDVVILTLYSHSVRHDRAFWEIFDEGRVHSFECA
jgi:hypothetical protein